MNTPFDTDMNPMAVFMSTENIMWHHPPGLAATERTPGEVEKTITDILGDLRGPAVSGGAAKQIRDAAADRVKQVESDQTFHRAIKGGS